MSRLINRNIRTVPKEQWVLSTIPRQAALPSSQHAEDFFGENVFNESTSTNSTLSSSLSDDPFLNHSSSSSLSWGDDFDPESTRNVQNELEKMDRVFRGLEPIPDNYDAEEIEEWRIMFPNIRLLNDTPPHSSTCRSNANYKASPNRDCDIRYTSKHITESVIKRICASVSMGAPNQPIGKVNLKNELTDFQNPNNYLDDYLKISPMKLRHPSSKSVMERRSLATPHLENNSYVSLPFLQNSSLPKQAITGMIAKQSKNLTLPPIDNSIRSISATTRHVNLLNRTGTETASIRNRIESRRFLRKNNSPNLKESHYNDYLIN